MSSEPSEQAEQERKLPPAINGTEERLDAILAALERMNTALRQVKAAVKDLTEILTTPEESAAEEAPKARPMGVMRGKR